MIPLSGRLALFRFSTWHLSKMGNGNTYTCLLEEGELELPELEEQAGDGNDDRNISD
jgi:hypothetical protein